MADEQPLQAHLRNKPAKEPSAKEAVQPNARQAGIRLKDLKAAQPHKYDKNPKYNVYG
jgi:hypothetical protein